MSVGTLEGEKFLLLFDSILEIKDATKKIYGFHKCKDLSKKQSASVAKTTVHIVFDESGSQVLVPESQLSPGLKEKSGEEEKKLSKYKTQQPLESLRTQGKNNSQEKLRGDSSKITPSRKRKVSEASVLIPGNTSVSTRSPLSFVSTSTPFKGRLKLPLEMTSSTKRSDNNAINESRTKNSYQEPPRKMCSEEVSKTVQEATEKQTLDEVFDIVPDSQPAGRSKKPLLPGLLETSFDKTEPWKKRTFPLPEKNVTTGGKQNPNLSLARASHAARVPDTSLLSDLAQEDPDVLRKEPANPKQSKTKPKSKEMADTAKSLISKISDRYRDKSDEKSKARDSLGFNRTYLNKSWISKEEAQDRTLKTASFLNITTGHVLDDVYNFNISGFDEPTIKLGIQELRVTELSVHTETSKKGNTAISKSSTERKEGKKTRNNRDKKHLFSDSDTENRGDDSKTEISWLQESKRKPKAQIINYSRNKKLGKPVTTDKNASPEPACYMDKAKGKTTNKKKVNCRNCSPGAEGVSGGVSPEHSSTERSLSLQESTPEDREVLNSKRGTSPSNFCPQNKSMESLAVTQSPETAVPKLTFGRKSFSPVLTETSLVRLSLTTYKTVSGKSSKGAAAETSKNNEDSSSQHSFLDTFSVKGKLQDITKPIPKNKEETSLTTEKLYKTDSGKRAKGAVLETGNNNEDSSLQSCFSDTLSAKNKLQDPTKLLNKSKEDCVAPSPLSASSRKKVQSWIREPFSPMNESGPTVQTFLKRTYHSSTESSSDEAETSKEEKKKGRRRINLKPKKLFKTDDAATYRVSESVSTQSVNERSGLDGEFWGPDCSTISICQQLQKEFTKKIENRSRKMDNFSKQTLRAAHQHLATMTYQLHECRIRQLDKFHFTLVEELEKFEKDSQSLKIMEKEFSVCIFVV
ncbi:hypothetical protein HGM15179_005563 [Zosterops borbonicus]|uniref:Synaptonemal complex protein 2 n=1 Tax=Zosterops borbonicus TaxID=364589 RepID=A0A8K1LPN8_9PASS|nr:hypothetical protein HGM15179_005563 [Zosterops borbonicus]